MKILYYIFREGDLLSSAQQKGAKVEGESHLDFGLILPVTQCKGLGGGGALLLWSCADVDSLGHLEVLETPRATLGFTWGTSQS